MNNSIKIKNHITILPFINDIVDHLEELLENKCENEDEKRIMIMFILTYAYSHLTIVPKNTKINNIDKKNLIKITMTNIIMDRNKRLQIIQMFQNFEKDTLINFVEQNTPLKITE